MASILPDSTTVCIVGAGPSGLACALGLAARKVPFVVVDALESGHNSSRAVAMQPGALEALNWTHPNLASELASEGVQSGVVQSIDVYERPVLQIRMHDLAPYTKFPFVLLMPQHKFEQRMHEALPNGVVYWRKKVLGMRESGDHYELSFESGEKLTAKYVVAADGTKSTIRQFAGIKYLNPFTGNESTPASNDPSFVVADVLFEEPVPPNLPRDGLQVMVGGGGMVLTAPLQSDDQKKNFYRLYLGVSTTPPPSPDAAYLQAALNTHGPGSHNKSYPVPRIMTVLESSRFQTRRALAEQYVQQSSGEACILLVGDAAHTHGPGGAQGMHLGVCDGCELAEAISTGSLEKLNAWGVRRRAVAREVIDMVEGIMEVEQGRMDWVSWIRMNVMWLVAKLPFVNGALAWRMSGLVHLPKRPGK